MLRKPFRTLSNDLFADLRCICPHKLFPEDTKMTHCVKLTGYNDANFFDNVNAQPQIRECKCGRKYTVQWFRDGVEAEFLDEQEL